MLLNTRLSVHKNNQLCFTLIFFYLLNVYRNNESLKRAQPSAAKHKPWAPGRGPQQNAEEPQVQTSLSWKGQMDFGLLEFSYFTLFFLCSDTCSFGKLPMVGGRREGGERRRP